jgi:ribosomal protein S18 acetylase RimI-like enzyme
MIHLKQYIDNDYIAIKDYFPKKEIDKNVNRGKFRLLSILALYKSYYYLLWDDNKVIGCGVIRWKWSREIHQFGWWLYSIWIHPAYRGKGISKILMNKLIHEVKAKNTKKVYLIVEKDNFIAKNLYNKIGFIKINENLSNEIMSYDL